MRSKERGARSQTLIRVACACAMLLLVHRVVAAPFSFDDIQFWVGDGANRAALAIDWVEDSTERPALVWGYRWDGTANGRDMLLAVLAADDRLYAKLGVTSMTEPPDKVYGLGYDANDDGTFGIRDGTTFDPSGIAIGNAPFFGTTATDSADYYAEGWAMGFWHYAVSSGDPFNRGVWADSGTGMVSRALVDGSWDSWAFTPSFDFAAFAENPVAAELPGALAGDFNPDGQVDAADYVVWRKNDDTQPGYATWRHNFGATAGAGEHSAVNAPEPNATLFIAIVLLFFQFAVRTKPLMNANRR